MDTKIKAREKSINNDLENPFAESSSRKRSMSPIEILIFKKPRKLRLQDMHAREDK